MAPPRKKIPAVGYLINLVRDSYTERVPASRQGPFVEGATAMSQPTVVSRRSFLKPSAAGAAALGAPALGAQGANERLNVGCIGTGGRCRALMQSLAKVPNVRIAAVCDVYEPHLDLARKLA